MHVEPVWIIAAVALSFAAGLLVGFRIGFLIGREDAEIDAAFAAMAAADKDPAKPAAIPQASRRMQQEADAKDAPRRVRWLADQPVKFTRCDNQPANPNPPLARHESRI